MISIPEFRHVAIVVKDISMLIDFYTSEAPPQTDKVKGYFLRRSFVMLAARCWILDKYE